jgi:hypothetical protein
MYISKFLLNRQKIFNPAEISAVIESYLQKDAREPGKDYIYRLEWYKIGVVVPVLVYSTTLPEMRVQKEFQLIEAGMGKLADVKKGNKTNFSVFLVPDFKKNISIDDDFEEICEWFKHELKYAAIVKEIDHGPDNCIFYEINSKNLKQQTITLHGQLAVTNAAKLEKLCSQAIGQCAELGCGLLHIPKM